LVGLLMFTVGFCVFGLGGAVYEEIRERAQSSRFYGRTVNHSGES
jgi:hypothetical protein